MPKTGNSSLLSQTDTIARGLSETFSSFCGVMAHDLKNPEHATLSIRNDLSGRQPGQPATELGLARIVSPGPPSIIANYSNQFADGRPVKNTSIGIEDEDGKYVAALCLNIGMTLFRSIQSALARFAETENSPIKEHIDPGSSEVIYQHIDDFVAKHATTARALRSQDRKLLVQQLRQDGLPNVRKSMGTVVQHLGVSRAAVYLYARQSAQAGEQTGSDRPHLPRIEFLPSIPDTKRSRSTKGGLVPDIVTHQ